LKADAEAAMENWFEKTESLRYQFIQEGEGKSRKW
jgi:hypothetical protein